MKRLIISLGFIAIACITVKASQDSLQQYVAKYKFPEGSPLSEVSILFENGTLQITSAIGSSNLEKTGEDQFAITPFNGIATFVRNNSKKITLLKIEAMGISMEGTKEENNENGNGKIILPMKFPMPMIPTDL